MLEQAMLSERFRFLLSRQEQATRMYDELAAKTVDPDMRQEIQQLVRDKQRHVRLTERLLEIVQ